MLLFIINFTVDFGHIMPSHFVEVSVLLIFSIAISVISCLFTSAQYIHFPLFP